MAEPELDMDVLLKLAYEKADELSTSLSGQPAILLFVAVGILTARAHHLGRSAGPESFLQVMHAIARAMAAESKAIEEGSTFISIMDQNQKVH